MNKFKRVSLRSIFILTLLVCVALAAFPRKAVRDYRRQAEAVEKLASTNFKLESRTPRTKSLPYFLKWFVPAGDLTQVFAVDGRSKAIKDEDLEVLKDLPWLERLDLADNNISDAGVAHLDQCHELWRVSLWGTKVTDDGLAVFSNKRNLGFIDIGTSKGNGSGNSLLTRGCLKHFAGLPRLEGFHFNFPIEDEELAIFATLPRFAPVKLAVSEATDTGIGHLVKWPSLKTLSLSGGTYSSLAPLQSLKRLRDLSIQTEVDSDQQLSGLESSRSVQNIDLKGVNNESLGQFLRKTKSSSLRIESESIDLDCLSSLGTEFPFRQLVFKTPISSLKPCVSKPIPSVHALSWIGNRTLCLRSSDAQYPCINFKFDQPNSFDCSQLKYFPNLKQLSLQMNRLGDAESYETLDKLEEFYHMRLGYGALKWLSRHPRLKRLSCTIQDDDSNYKFDAPLPFPALEKLHLSAFTGNPDLFTKIVDNKTLKHLKLEIGQDVEFTGEGFEKLESLSWLKVTGISDAAVENICQANSVIRKDKRVSNYRFDNNTLYFPSKLEGRLWW